MASDILEKGVILGSSRKVTLFNVRFRRASPREKQTVRGHRPALGEPGQRFLTQPGREPDPGQRRAGAVWRSGRL